MQTLLFR